MGPVYMGKNPSKWPLFMGKMIINHWIQRYHIFRQPYLDLCVVPSTWHTQLIAVASPEG